MNKNKIPTGHTELDNELGGLFRNRCHLLCGRHGSGKTQFAMHVIDEALTPGMRTLYSSEESPRDLLLLAETFGWNWPDALAEGRLVLMQHPSQPTGDDLPAQLHAIRGFASYIADQAISFVVMDGVLGWLISSVDGLADRIQTLVESLESVPVTSLFTVPRPVSPQSMQLVRWLVAEMPGAFEMDIVQQGPVIRPTKYIGLHSPFPQFRSPDASRPSIQNEGNGNEIQYPQTSPLTRTSQI